MTPKSRRLLSRPFVVLSATISLVAGLTLPATAIGVSTFESTDGNMAASVLDWSNVTGVSTGADNFTGADDESFGQGTKEDTPVPTVVTGSIPPNKSDLTRFYVTHEVIGANAYMYLAWVRSNNLGTANMDFEFNKNACSTSSTAGCSANGVTPIRTPGDILITFDFSGGGSTVSLGLLKWLTAGNGDSASACFASNKLPCWGSRTDLSSASEADGSVNQAGGITDPLNGNAPIVQNGFGEAAIDLVAALDLGPNDCTSFGSAYLKSRSSDSFTSAVKDFVPPVGINITLCQPATIKVAKTDSSTTNPLNGATFALYRDTNGNGTLTLPGDELIDTCITGEAPSVNGGCTFSPTVSGSGTVRFFVKEISAPAGYIPDTANVKHIDITFATSAQTFTVNFSNAPAPGTVNILKKDDANNLLSGRIFRLWNDLTPKGTFDSSVDTTTSKTCTTNASGACSITNIALGDYCIVEESVPSGYDAAPAQCFTVGLGSSEGQGQTISLTFVNPRQHRVVVLVCHEGTNTLHASGVSFDAGATQTSLSGAGLSASQQASLCNAGGAVKGNISGHGSVGINVNIGNH